VTALAEPLEGGSKQLARSAKLEVISFGIFVSPLRALSDKVAQLQEGRTQRKELNLFEPRWSLNFKPQLRSHMPVSGRRTAWPELLPCSRHGHLANDGAYPRENLT
jgi:hypothetical protein